MADSRVAKRYATALFNIATQQGIVNAVDDDLSVITTALSRSENFRTFMKSPQTTEAQKLVLLDRTFGDRVTALTMHVLRLLVEKLRDDEIFGVHQEFAELRRISGGVVKAEIATAIPLDEDHKALLVAKIKSLTGREVEPHFLIDEKLIGGVKVTYDNNVLDGTARGSLNRIKDHLIYDVLKQA